MTQAEICAVTARKQHKDRFQVLIEAAKDKGVPERHRWDWARVHDALGNAVIDPQDDLEAMEIICAAEHAFTDSLDPYWSEPIADHCDQYIAARLAAGRAIDSTVVELRNALRYCLKADAAEKTHGVAAIGQGAM